MLQSIESFRLFVEPIMDNNIAVRFCPTTQMTVLKCCSATYWRKADHYDRCKAIMSITGSGFLEVYVGAAVRRRPDGTAEIAGCLHHCATPVATVNALSHYLRFLVGERISVDVACSFVSYYFNVRTFPNVFNSFSVVSSSCLDVSPPDMVHVQSVDDLFGDIESLQIQGLTEIGAGIAAGAICVAGTVATFCMRRKAIYNRVFRQTVLAKPSDLACYLPVDLRLWLERNRINPVHALFFTVDTISYFHGQGSRASLTLRGAEIFGVGYAGISILVDLANDFILSCCSTPEPLSIQGVTEFLDGAASVMGAIPNRSSIMRSAKDLHSLVLGARDVSSVLSVLCDWMPLWVRQFVASMMPDQGWYVLVQDLDVEKLFQEADLILTPANIGVVSFSNTGYPAFQIVYDKLLIVQSRVEKVSCPPAFSTHLRSLVQRGENVFNAHARWAASDGKRFCPFSFMLCGDSRSGKSTLCRELLMAFGEFYPRSWGSSHWSGYHGQIGTEIDDWGCDNKTNDGYREFIQMISSSRFIPEFASLDDPTVGIKGTEFNSLIVGSTTNNSFPRPFDWPCYDNIYERRHVLIRVTRTSRDGEPFEATYAWISRFPPGHRLYEAGEHFLSRDSVFELIKEKFLAHMANEQRVLDAAYQTGWKVEIPVMRTRLEADTEPLAQIPVQHDFTRADAIWAAELARVTAAMRRDQRPPLEIPVEPLALSNCFAYASIAYKDFVASHPYVPVCLLGTASLGALILAYKLLGPKIKAQAATGYPTSPGRTITLRKGAQSVRRPMIQGDGERHKVAAQIGWLEGWTDGGKRTKLHCLHSQKCLLVPSHFFRVFVEDPDEIVHVVWSKFGLSGPIPLLYTFDIDGSDVTTAYGPDGNVLDFQAISLPPQCPTGPDLSHFFMDSVRVPSCEVDLYSRDTDGNLRLIHTVAKRNVEKVCYGQGTQYTEVDETWIYSARTHVGDCGSLLVGRVHGQDVVLGLHVASNDGRGIGYAVSIDKAWVVEATKSASSVTMPQIQGDSSAVPTPREWSDCHFYLMSRGDVYNHVSGKTVIEKSVLHGCMGPPTTHPAVLRPGDERVLPSLRTVSPLRKAAAKGGCPGGRAFSVVPFEQAVGWAISKFGGLSVFEPRVLSANVSVNGDVDLGYESLDFTSGPGYPWKNTGDKLSHFDQVGNWRQMKPPLEEAVLRRIDLAERGARDTTIWLDCLKDERRPWPKIEGCSTRVINSGPLDFLIVFRMYFMAFFGHLNSLFERGPSTLGMDCESNEFHHLLTRLSKHPLCFDGDIHNNDGQFPPELLVGCLRVVQSFYGGADRTVRSVLMDEIMYSVHLCGDVMYMVSGGIPSGCCGTSAFDTVGNAINFAYVWFNVAPLDLCTNAAFDDNVEFGVNGDDNLFSVSEAVSHFFNPMQVAAQFSILGREYTAADKESSMRFKKLTECQFLKRTVNTTLFPGLYVACLPTEVILDCAYYIRKSDNPSARAVDNANASLSFAAHRGKEFFSQLRAAYSAVLIFSEPLLTWESALAFMYRKHYGR